MPPGENCPNLCQTRGNDCAPYTPTHNLSCQTDNCIPTDKVMPPSNSEIVGERPGKQILAASPNTSHSLLRCPDEVYLHLLIGQAGGEIGGSPLRPVGCQSRLAPANLHPQALLSNFCQCKVDNAK